MSSAALKKVWMHGSWKKNKTLENNTEQTDLHGRKNIKQNNNSWNFLSDIPFWNAISFELEPY